MIRIRLNKKKGIQYIETFYIKKLSYFTFNQYLWTYNGFKMNKYATTVECFSDIL